MGHLRTREPILQRIEFRFAVLRHQDDANLILNHWRHIHLRVIAQVARWHIWVAGTKRVANRQLSAGQKPDPGKQVPPGRAASAIR